MDTIVKTKNIWIYLISFMVLLLCYSQNLNDAFKGEMWELLRTFESDLPWFDKAGEISQFVCFGHHRFQPLAYFVPYLSYLLFGTSFFGSHVFALFLHVSCGVALFILMSQYIPQLWIRLAVFLLFLFSFVDSSVVIWTFFTYVQFHSFLLILAIFSFLSYTHTGRNAHLYLSWVLGLASAYMYEAGISLFIAQALFFLTGSLTSQNSRRTVRNIAGPTLVLVLYMLTAYLTTSFQYTGSNLKFHPAIFYKMLVFIAYYFRHNLGLTSQAEIHNIASLSGMNLSFTVWNIIGLVLLFALLVFVIDSYLSFIKQRKFKQPEFLFSFYVLFFYLLVIAFGRVLPDTSFSGYSGFVTQFRYYYLPSLLIPFLVAIPISTISHTRRVNIILIVVITFALTGNIMNILSFGGQVYERTLPLTVHAFQLQWTHPETKNSKKAFVTQMHRDWYLRKIETPIEYAAYVFNAHQCHSCPEIELTEPPQEKLLTLTQKFRELRGDIPAVISEIDLRKFQHTASSYLPGTGPEKLAQEQMWHVNHIPYPPANAWVMVDFKVEEAKRVVELRVKPRRENLEHFWNDATFAGSNDGATWEDIVHIQLSQPPPDGWLVIRFANPNYFRFYRLMINGGFAEGRFMSFSGWKMFESIEG